MLHAMFSGRFDTKPGEDGSYFIDRDGTHFRHILNYLRTGKLVLPDDKVVRKELLSEAEFYRIDGILDELKANPFKDSAILSSEQRETLVDWLKHTRESLSDDYVLLYRASRDGWTASNFHSRCDNKGPTVTVIKSGNYIFGGYTEQAWQSSSKRPFFLYPSSPSPPLMIKYLILIFCSQSCCLLSLFCLGISIFFLFSFWGDVTMILPKYEKNLNRSESDTFTIDLALQKTAK